MAPRDVCGTEFSFDAAQEKGPHSLELSFFFPFQSAKTEIIVCFVSLPSFYLSNHNCNVCITFINISTSHTCLCDLMDS